MASIKINTGLKTYDIENEKGEILGQISFNATDLNLLSKIYDLQETLVNAMEEFSAVTNENALDTIQEQEVVIKTAIDDVFGEGISKTIFGRQSVFSEIDGQTFLERFIDAVLPVVKADLEEALAKKVEKIEDYKSQVVEE